MFRSISYADDEMMSCVPLPTVATATTRIKQDMETGPFPTPQYSNTTHRKLSVSTQLLIKTTPTSEATSDSLPQWMIGGIASMLSLAVLVAFIVMAAVGIRVTYTSQRRKKAKSVTGGAHISKLRDTKLIHVGTESQQQVMLTRRQHVCSKVSSDETYNRVHDAASPEPEVLVIVESEETADQDSHTSMPYEHQKYLHHNVSHLPDYQCHNNMTPSQETYNNHPPNPVYDGVDSGSFYDSTTHVTDQDFPTPDIDKTTPQNGISTSVSGPSTINTRYKSKNRDPGSSFQYPLTDGAVYSTRTTTSSSCTRPSYPTSPTHCQTRGYHLTSSHRTSGAGRRTTSSQTSGVSHHLSATGGSTISSSRTATSPLSTRGSANSIMTLHE